MAAMSSWPSSFSIEAWIKIAGKQGYGRLVGQYDHTLPDEAGRGWENYIHDTSEVILRTNDGQRDIAVKTKRKLPVDQWTYLVCVFEGKGGRMKVYIGGQNHGDSLPPIIVFASRHSADFFGDGIWSHTAAGGRRSEFDRS